MYTHTALQLGILKRPLLNLFLYYLHLFFFDFFLLTFEILHKMFCFACKHFNEIIHLELYTKLELYIINFSKKNFVAVPENSRLGANTFRLETDLVMWRGLNLIKVK